MQTGKIVRFLSSQKFGNNKFGNIQRRTFQLSEIVHPTVKLGNSIREYLEILCNSNYILLSVRVLSGTTSSTSSMSSSNVNMNLTAQQYYVTQEKGTERVWNPQHLVVLFKILMLISLIGIYWEILWSPWKRYLYMCMLCYSIIQVITYFKNMHLKNYVKWWSFSISVRKPNTNQALGGHHFIWLWRIKMQVIVLKK